MKRINNLYNKINDMDIIMNMYDNVVSKNTRNKKKINNFDDYYSCNIINIKNIINNCNYIPDKYNIFFIREPKLRIIMSQSIKDKVINHLVAKYFLIDIFDKTLINENCATRINKGTHYGLKLFKKYINYYKNKYDKFYILKLDISKYFYNIDHNIVKKLINDKIKDRKVLNIINSIVDSTDSSYVNQKIQELKLREKNRINNLNISDKEKHLRIAEIDRLPIYIKGKGLPIGNMTSQILAIFYLNELDHYIKEVLNINCYVRYMDDFCLIHHDKEYLRNCLNKIEKILKKYELKLNNKTKIYTSLEEVEFLGFRFMIKNNKIIIKVSNNTKKRLKKKINNVKHDYNKFRNVRDSYLGHLRYGNCKRLAYKII